MDLSVLSALCKKQKIAVPPAVFETGTDDYVIIFETELKGSGYVKIKGKEKTYWDAPSGIIATHDTVHTIRVPKDELRGNSYIVGSQHIPFKYDYSAVKGNFCESDEYHFRGVPCEDDVKLLLLTDIHEKEPLVRDALKHFSDKYDMLIMLGDIASSFMKKEKFTKVILSDAAEFSKGEIPVVYTRGNHETRGEYASQLLRYFPTSTGEFYYTFDFGPLSAVVLDSGEDKEDDHREYSGLIDFHSYREKEYKWIKSLKKEQFNGKYRIVFCHHPEISNHFRRDWQTPFAQMGFDLVVGGHYHISRFIENSPPSFVACGRYSDGWAASSLILKNDTIKMITVNNRGEELMNRLIPLK